MHQKDQNKEELQHHQDDASQCKNGNKTKE